MNKFSLQLPRLNVNDVCRIEDAVEGLPLNDAKTILGVKRLGGGEELSCDLRHTTNTMSPGIQF